jgi:phosphotransferase system HPr (HPr) family protein
VKQTPASESVAEYRDLEILNKHGMHARPAALFIKTANRFESDITLEKGDARVSGRSIMGLLTLELYQGSKMRVHASGPDAKEALDAIEKLVRDKFDEE